MPTTSNNNEFVSQSDSELKNEKDVVKLLLHNEESVAQACGFDLQFATIEQETQYGNVDIMAYSSKMYAHPIEVKYDLATHAIVGQITKYMKHFLRRVNYGYFRDVIGITIAQRYSDHAYQELKKLNVVILTHKRIGKKLVLTKI